jgi:hypothetical protein
MPRRGSSQGDGQCGSRPLEHIGSYLQPQVTRRATIGSEYPSHRQAALREYLYMMPEAEHHAFERSTPDVPQIVRQAQSDRAQPVRRSVPQPYAARPCPPVAINQSPGLGFRILRKGRGQI